MKYIYASIYDSIFAAIFVLFFNILKTTPNGFIPILILFIGIPAIASMIFWTFETQKTKDTKLYNYVMIFFGILMFIGVASGYYQFTQINIVGSVLKGVGGP